MASVDHLLESIRDLGTIPLADEAERIRVREALSEALRKVQTPWDIAWDLNWTQPCTQACAKTLIDAGIFTKWAEQGGKPAKSAELARLVGADELLIKRLMRQISGQNLIMEVGEDEYAMTPWAEKMVSDPALASIYGDFYKELNISMYTALPYFLKSTGYKNPTDVNNSNWQFYTGKPENYFQDVGANPGWRDSFNDAMECHSKYNLTPWPEVFPTQTLLDGAKPDRALLVDLGGGKGHDLAKFSLRHPEAPKGSLILQDLPEIIKEIKPMETITVQPHDFFTPQPVKGARAYFLHNVLHDWLDDEVVKILSNIAAAMEKGYSKVIVHESLISAIKPSPRVTVTDITVMACLSAKERTEAEWVHVFDRAGLRVIKVWRAVQAVESVIEAELKE